MMNYMCSLDVVLGHRGVGRTPHGAVGSDGGWWESTSTTTLSEFVLKEIETRAHPKTWVDA